MCSSELMYRRACITALCTLASAAQLGAQGTRAVRQQGAPVASTTAAINKVWDDALATFKSGDASAMAAMYTADAVMIDPTMATVSGRANIEKAMKDVAENRTLEVPQHLKGTGYKGAKTLGHGEGYKYAHDYEGHHVAQQYLERKIRYYFPTEQGYEKTLKDYLESIKP